MIDEGREIYEKMENPAIDELTKKELLPKVLELTEKYPPSRNFSRDTVDKFLLPNPPKQIGSFYLSKEDKYLRLWDFGWQTSYSYGVTPAEVTTPDYDEYSERACLFITITDKAQKPKWARAVEWSQQLDKAVKNTIFRDESIETKYEKVIDSKGIKWVKSASIGKNNEGTYHIISYDTFINNRFSIEIKIDIGEHHKKPIDYYTKSPEISQELFYKLANFEWLNQLPR